jgi:hypothetical protein
MISKLKTVEPLAMRVLGRLLGSSVPDLVDRIEGMRAGQPVPMQERLLCARLLALRCRDQEAVDVLVAGADSPLLKRCIALSVSPELMMTDASVALLVVFTKVASAKSEYIVSLESLGAITAATEILEDRLNDQAVFTEATSFFAAMIDCFEMIVVLELAGQSHEAALKLVLKGFDALVAHADVANAFLTLLEKLIFYDYPASKLISSGALEQILNAMRTLKDVPSIQLLATELLVFLASHAKNVDQMVSSGVVPLVMRNLLHSPLTKGEAASMGSSNDIARSLSRDLQYENNGNDDEDESKNGQTSDKFAVALDTELTASSLYLITSLCVTGTHVEAMKRDGIIKAVLKGFSRHSQDALVYRFFREVISALCIA